VRRRGKEEGGRRRRSSHPIFSSCRSEASPFIGKVQTRQGEKKEEEGKGWTGLFRLFSWRGETRGQGKGERGEKCNRTSISAILLPNSSPPQAREQASEASGTLT